MGSTIKSCENCPDRHPGCHSSCEKYQREKADYEKKRLAYLNRQSLTHGLDSQRYDNIRRATKRDVYRSKYRKGH